MVTVASVLRQRLHAQTQAPVAGRHSATSEAEKRTRRAVGLGLSGEKKLIVSRFAQAHPGGAAGRGRGSGPSAPETLPSDSGAVAPATREEGTREGGRTAATGATAVSDGKMVQTRKAGCLT